MKFAYVYLVGVMMPKGVGYPKKKKKRGKKKKRTY